MEGSVVLACASSRATTATTLLPTSMASRGRRLSQAQVRCRRREHKSQIVIQLQYSFYRQQRRSERVCGVGVTSELGSVTKAAYH